MADFNLLSRNYEIFQNSTKNQYAVSQHAVLQIKPIYIVMLAKN